MRVVAPLSSLSYANSPSRREIFDDGTSTVLVGRLKCSFWIEFFLSARAPVVRFT